MAAKEEQQHLETNTRNGSPTNENRSVGSQLEHSPEQHQGTQRNSTSENSERRQYWEITTRCRRDWENYLLQAAIPEFQNPNDGLDNLSEAVAVSDHGGNHGNGSTEPSLSHRTTDKPDYTNAAEETSQLGVSPGSMTLRYFRGSRRH